MGQPECFAYGGYGDRYAKFEGLTTRRELADPHLTHGHFAALIIQPEVNIVVLILTALATEVSARKIAAILLKLPYWLVHLHELEREFRASLVVGKLIDAVVLAALFGN